MLAGHPVLRSFIGFFVLSLILLSSLSHAPPAAGQSAQRFQSWNPAVPCVPILTTIEEILGNVVNENGGADYSGGAFKPGLLHSEGTGKRDLTPPCTITDPDTGKTVPTFVEVHNVIIITNRPMIVEDNGTSYHPDNGGGSYPINNDPAGSCEPLWSNIWCDITSNIVHVGQPAICKNGNVIFSDPTERSFWTPDNTDVTYMFGDKGYRLEWETYDAEHADEVSVLLNDQLILTYPTSETPENNDAWISMSLNITNYVIPGTNTLVFRENGGSGKIRRVVVLDSDIDKSGCMHRIHIEIDRDWRAAGIAPPIPTASNTNGWEAIDIQGFVYWDGPPNAKGHLDRAWHQFSGWEIHPVTAWRQSKTTTLATSDTRLTKGLPASSAASIPSDSTVWVLDEVDTSQQLWMIDPSPWAVKSATGSVSVSYTSSIRHILEWEGFDYDNKGEVTITLNGIVIADLPTMWAVENNDAWVKFSVIMTDLENNNTLTFTQNSGPVLGETSSKIRNLVVKDQNGLVIFSDAGERSLLHPSEPSTTYTFPGTRSQGSVVIRNTLSNIDGDFGMGGFAKIIYGRRPWGGLASDQAPIFPMQLKNVDELTSDVSYDLSYNQMGGNIAYQLWLTEVPNTQDNTGAIEVQVWLWRRNMVTGVDVTESITMPIKVNGATIQANFDFYLDPAPEHGSGGRVWFLLDDAQMIQSGNVELSLLSFVKITLEKLGKTPDLFLQGVEFGTQYTDANQDYTFTLIRFQIRQTLAPPAPTAGYTLEWETYDAEHAIEALVLLNDQLIFAYPITEAPANNDAWISKSMDITNYIVSGTNTLVFRENGGSGQIRNVVLVDPDGRVIFSDSTARWFWTPDNKDITYTFTI